MLGMTTIAKQTVEFMAMSYRMEIVEDYSGQFKLRIPRSLHRLLAEHSKREGIIIYG